ncbi:hypothetical protein LCGC14_0942030 [marine sediment metagenome]|uniref:Peptide deformylase n=1 Tax=marine sediment metagenome TaxID=412755 RepID=A0A0F9NPH7_9ZZZZ
MSLNIVTFDEEALRQETHEVEVPLTGELKLFVAHMIQTMVTAEGLGLAAPQVNRPERIFVAELNEQYHVFVNPTIVEFSDSCGTEEEACLSLPGVTVVVRRPKFIRISYYDVSGTFYKRKKFKRMDARVIQHEFDHLEGKLISDYASSYEVG